MNLLNKTNQNMYIFAILIFSMPLLSSSLFDRLAHPLQGHWASIGPALLRKERPAVNPKNITIPTPDGDFLEADHYLRQSDCLLVVSHGLEGNARRPYILGLVAQGLAQGIDVLAWNFRSCGQKQHRSRRFYHSGATDDLEVVVQHALAAGAYRRVLLAGFSLGGNLTLKYLGERGTRLAPEIQGAFVASVPCDLSACAQSLRRYPLYEWYFLKSLRKKIKKIAQTFPDIQPESLAKVRHIWDFDEYYTAPLHGFAGAEDYYMRCSALHYLEGIQVPTLLLSAQNDPFLPEACFPKLLAAAHNFFYLEMPALGGHCGFATKQGTYWAEQRAIAFWQEQGLLPSEATRQ
jgi:predicted alpha/beta-fold hydrolase